MYSLIINYMIKVCALKFSLYKVAGLDYFKRRSLSLRINSDRPRIISNHWAAIQLPIRVSVLFSGFTMVRLSHFKFDISSREPDSLRFLPREAKYADSKLNN